MEAIIHHEDYLFLVALQSRTKVGQTPENLFNEFNDGFIYNVLMANLKRFAPVKEASLIFEELFIHSLDPDWGLIRMGNDQWNLTHYKGYFKVYLTQAPLSSPDTLLLRYIENENFEIVTRVIFEPKRNYQRVGLVIYENRDNYVALLRAHSDFKGSPGNAIYFDHISPSAPGFDDPNYTSFSTQISSPNDVYLRLKRNYNVYTAYYSLDGQTWVKIGEHISTIEPVSYGLLIGKTDIEIYALIDFFELHILD